MTQRDPSAPSRLLQDLESIRTLLDEQPAEASQTVENDEPQLDIPLLQDVITEQLAIEEPVADPVFMPPATTPERPHNPFLPYDSLARLAEERLQLDRLLSGQTPPPPRPDIHTGAREVRLEARLTSEAQLILQDVLDELMPTIEEELRRRLQHKVEQLVREQLR